jgi:hypothetical protein
MSVDGTWNITMDTPMGSQPATLTLATSGNTLTGTQAAMGGSRDIYDGSVNGNDLAWKVDITQPMPMTLEFTGAVDGNKISGQMKAGAFGSWPFSGDRA